MVIASPKKYKNENKVAVISSSLALKLFLIPMR